MVPFHCPYSTAFSAAGYRKFGRRYAAVMVGLQKP